MAWLANQCVIKPFSPPAASFLQAGTALVASWARSSTAPEDVVRAIIGLAEEASRLDALWEADACAQAASSTLCGGTPVHAPQSPQLASSSFSTCSPPSRTHLSERSTCVVADESTRTAQEAVQPLLLDVLDGGGTADPLIYSVTANSEGDVVEVFGDQFAEWTGE